MLRVNTALLTGKTEVRKLQKFHIFCEEDIEFPAEPNFGGGDGSAERRK
jgi:hypothetical protein